MKKGKRARVRFALVVFLLCIFGIGAYYGDVYYQDYKVKNVETRDLVKLHEKYPDLVGWIKIEGTNVDYPVMQGKKYLKKNIKGEYYRSGTPFVTDEWTPSNNNTLLYGHNMSYNGTMFYRVTKYGDYNFYKKHPYVTLYIIDDPEAENVSFNKKTYHVGYAIKTSTRSWPYWTYDGQLEDEEWDKYVSQCKSRTCYQTEADFSKKDLLTLSTCSYHIRGSTGRFVLVGALENIEYYCNVMEK